MEFSAINKLSLLDYPNKVSCILYTNTCNFRCPYCHNGLTLLQDSPDPIPFEEILAFLKKRVGILDGVVISGGEPTLMPDLEDKIRAIKELGYEVKLDTNGTNPDILKHLIDEGLIDYVAMDIKASFSKYADIANIAVNITNIQKSIDILKSDVVDYEFRTTLIDEFHNMKSIKDMAKLIKGTKKLYFQKFVERDSCIQKGLHEVSKEEAVVFQKAISKDIKNVYLRGY